MDVTVVDRHGEPVTDLTQDDFDVREDASAQTVHDVKFVRSERRASDDDTSLTIRSGRSGRSGARRHSRVRHLLGRVSHRRNGARRLSGREALTDFVPQRVRADRPRRAGGSADADRRDSFDARSAGAGGEVHTLQGSLGVSLPPRSPMEEAQIHMARDLEVVRAQVTASALEGTVAYPGLAQGRGRRQGDPLRVSRTIGPPAWRA